MKKITAVILIPLLCFFIYQAIIRGISSVYLENARYFLYNNVQLELTEKQFLAKMQNALDSAEFLGVYNQEYHKLLASLNLWQANFSDSVQKSAVAQEKVINQAQQHYRLGLQAQPNNSYIWRRLAQTDINYSNTEFSLVAMKQAIHYAPSDNTILLDVILWKIPIWRQLYQKQKLETVEQIKYFAQARESNYQARQMLNQVLTHSDLKTTICNKLPRTQKFKIICL